jgi:hypothetical protein
LIYFLFALLSFNAFAVNLQPPVKVNKRLQASDLSFMGTVFHGGKMAQNMECEIKTRAGRELRKFKDQSKWVDNIELDYRTDRFGEYNEKIVISTGTAYGSRLVDDLGRGRVEEFRIDLNDVRSSFVEFAHDGKGNLTSFLFGDINRVYPCQIKNNN